MIRARQINATSRTHYGFILLLVAGGVAQFAFAAAAFAEPLIVLSLSGSVFQAGLVTTVIALVGVAASATASTFADRHPRRRTMVTCSILQLPIVGLLAWMLESNVMTVPLFLALSALSTAIGAYTSAPELAAITQIVPAHKMEAASGNYQARMYVATIVGPVIGGLLLGWSASLLYTVVASASAVSAALLLMLDDPLSVPNRVDRSGFLRDFVAGWRFVFQERFIRGMLFIQFWSNVAVSGALFLMIMSLRQAGNSPGIIGLVQCAIGAGGLLGALLVPVVTAQMRFTMLQICSKAILVAGLVVTTMLAGQLVMVVPLGLALLLSPSAGASVFARVARLTPSGLHGRVMNFHKLASTVGGSISSAAVGAMAAALSTTAAFAATVVGACGSLASAVILSSADRRHHTTSAM